MSRRHKLLHTSVSCLFLLYLSAIFLLDYLSNISNRVFEVGSVGRLDPSKSFTVGSRVQHEFSELKKRNETIHSLSLILPGEGGQPLSKVVNPHEYNYILNEPRACAVRMPDVLVLVHSSAADDVSRNRIRSSWKGEQRVDGVEFTTLFLLGRSTDMLEQESIKEESVRHADIIQEDFVDSYRNLSLKNVMGLKWMAQFCNATKLLVKVDSDVMINVKQLARFHNEKLNENGVLKETIYCSVFRHYKPRRDAQDKWFVSRKEYPYEFYPDHCEGFAYIVSGPNTAAKLYNSSLFTPYFWIDDVYVTGFLRRNSKIPLTPFQYSIGYGYATVNYSLKTLELKTLFFLFKYTAHNSRIWSELWLSLQNSTTK